MYMKGIETNIIFLRKQNNDNMKLQRTVFIHY